MQQYVLYVGDIFEGMNVPSSTTTESLSHSAFSFIEETNINTGNSVSTNPSSFSFIQSPPTEPETEEASKFLFLANTAEKEDTSSFSFLNNKETDPNNIDISTVRYLFNTVFLLYYTYFFSP